VLSSSRGWPLYRDAKDSSPPPLRGSARNDNRRFPRYPLPATRLPSPIPLQTHGFPFRLSVTLKVRVAAVPDVPLASAAEYGVAVTVCVPTEGVHAM